MSKVKMTFEPDMAKIVGSDAAIIYSNIDYWVDTNRANNRNFHDGKYWTYNSIKAFIEQFTWLSESQIKTCLSKLEKNEFILSGNYNSSPYDRTKWYTVTNKKPISDLPQMDKLESTDTLDDNSQPIPYIKPIENHIEETPLLFPDSDLNTKPLKNKTEIKENAGAKVLFCESKWSDYEVLKTHLAADKEFVKKYSYTDLKWYQRKADTWSENKQIKRTDRGWLMTIRDWISEAEISNTRVMIPKPKKVVEEEKGWTNQ